MTARLLLITAFALLLAAPAPAQPPLLAGDNVIEGTQTGYAQVRLDEPVDVRPDDESMWAWFDLEGDGWLYYMEMRAEKLAPDGTRPGVIVLRLDTCDVLGCGYWLLYAAPDELPAGDYRVYLATEAGERAKGTMRFPVRDGELKLAPTHPTPIDEARLTPFPGGTPLTTAFGRTGATVSEGVLYMRLRTHADSPSIDDVQTCTYWGGDEQAGPAAYKFGCDAIYEYGKFPRTTGYSVPRKGEDLVVIGWMDEAVRVGQGGNVTVAGLPPRFDVGLALLSFYEGAPPPVPAVPVPAQGPPPGTTLEAHTPRTASGVAEAPAAIPVSRRVRARRGYVRIGLSCPGRAACHGTLGFDGGRARKFSVPAEATIAYRVRLPARVIRRLRRKRSTVARLLVRSFAGDSARDRRVPVRILRPRPRPKT